MVNPLGHWLRILLGTRFCIPLRGLSRFRVIGFRIHVRVLSGFRVTPGLVVPADHTIKTIHCEILGYNIELEKE